MLSFVYWTRLLIGWAGGNTIQGMDEIISTNLGAGPSNIPCALDGL